MATVWIYIDTKKRAPDPGAEYYLSRFGAHDLALQLPFVELSESIGNHDSKIVGADSVD